MQSAPKIALVIRFDDMKRSVGLLPITGIEVVEGPISK